MNVAYTTKLAWRLISQPNSLLSRTLRGKYMKGGEVNFDIARYDYSSASWKGIMIASSWLKYTMSWSIGNGATVQFWT